MDRGTILVAALMAVLLAGCSSTGAADSAGGSGSGSAGGGSSGAAAAGGGGASDGGGGQGQGEGAAAIPVGTLVARGEITATATGLVTPEAGGSVQVDLGDGDMAVLEIPPGAVSEPVVVTLQAFTSGSVRGLRMEPDGLWLTRPGTLTVDGASALLMRIGAMPRGDLYATTVSTRPGSIPVVRLRPAIVEDDSVTPTPIGVGDGSGSGGSADFLGPIDPPDASAAGEEAREADDPDGEVEGTDEVRRAAGGAAGGMAQRCNDPNDPSSARFAATRLTAGLTGGELPECITRVVTITAQSAAEGPPYGSFSEVLGAEGEVSNAFESYRLPLEGEQTGSAQALTAFAQGLADAMQMATTVNCTVSRLQNGQVSVLLEALESGDLKVTVEPGGGLFIGSCGGKPVEMSPVTWSLVRDLKGMGPQEPFVFVLDRGKRTGNAFGDLQMLEELKVRPQADGTLVISDGGITISVSMWVGLSESMALLEQERKDAEVAGTAKPSKPATP